MMRLADAAREREPAAYRRAADEIEQHDARLRASLQRRETRE